MKTTVNKKMLITAITSMVLMTILIAAVLSFSIIEPGYAYWDKAEAGGSQTATSSNVNVSTSGTAINGISGTYFSPGLNFNPSAKYFTYQVKYTINGVTNTVATDKTLRTSSANGYSVNEVVLTAITTDDMTAATDVEVHVVGYTGNVTDIEIPSAITVADVANKAPVTTVRGISSTNTVGLTTIAIPASVTSIGTNCFSGYRSSLKEIRFESRTEILALSAHAFRYAVNSGTTTVYYANNVVSAKTGLTGTGLFTFATSTVFLGWS